MDVMIRSVVRCIHRRLRDDDDLTVEAISRELGFTRQYVSGRFHRKTGRLLSEFLREKKLEKAARLLRGGDLRVTQIAHLCGYESENYFRQQFRERYGISPKEFRVSVIPSHSRHDRTSH